MSPTMFHEIDDFKNIGIDVLNPTQSNAKETDPIRKKKDGRENGSQSHGQDQSLV